MFWLHQMNNHDIRNLYEISNLAKSQFKDEILFFIYKYPNLHPSKPYLHPELFDYW